MWCTSFVIMCSAITLQIKSQSTGKFAACFTPISLCCSCMTREHMWLTSGITSISKAEPCTPTT